MTETRNEFVRRARTLSERVDVKPGQGREKPFADALVAEMRNSGLLAVSVPGRLGGPGLDVAGIADITFEIARQSGSAGLIYAMHASQAFSLSTHGTGAWFDQLQKRMLEEQLLIASGTSEQGPGGDILTSLCSVEQAGDGNLFIRKESPNISYIDHADLILVSANYAPDGKRSRQVLVAAEVEEDKFEAVREVEFLGMKGIRNRPYAFRTDFPPEAVFEADFAMVARRTMTPSIQIFWAALWSGIAWSVIDKVKQCVANDVDPKSEPYWLLSYELTRLVDKHHMMNTMIRAATAAYSDPEQGSDMGFGLSAQINRVKVNCSELLIEICTRAMMIIGIRGYATAGPYSLAEHIADAMSAPIMVSNFRLALNTAKVERFVDESLSGPV